MFAQGSATLTVTLSSQQTLWLDSNKCNAQGPRGAWLSFIIKNTGTAAASNVSVVFAGFTGANASFFSAPSDLARSYGTIAAGAQYPAYFYVDYSVVCNNPHSGGTTYDGYTANYTVTAAASGLSNVVFNGVVTTSELLTANAAGQAATITVGPGFYLGQLLSQTVTYSFGNNSDLFFNPPARPGSMRACVRLVSSAIPA